MAFKQSAASFLSYTFCIGKSFGGYMNFLYPQLRRKCSNDLTFVEISLWPGLTGIFSVHFIKSILLIEHKRSQMMCSRKQIISQMGRVGQWEQTWNFNPLFISSPSQNKHTQNIILMSHVVHYVHIEMQRTLTYAPCVCSFHWIRHWDVWVW